MKTLLLLEDEPLVMKLLRHMLKRYDLIAVTTGEEALQAFDNPDRPVDLLITDVRLPPHLSGIQVALRIRSVRPLFPIVLMSGYPLGAWRGADGADLEQLGSESVILLQKPFQTEALLGAVYGLLGESLTGTARPA